jgi:hypothetical protein
MADELIFGIVGAVLSILFLLAVIFTMIHVEQIKRLQEDSLKTLLEIRHGLVMITAILTRNDTTDPATSLKKEINPDSVPISKKPDDVGSKISFDDWAKQNPIETKE